METTRKLDFAPPKPNFWKEEDEKEGLDRMVKKFSLISKSSKHQILSKNFYFTTT